MNGELIRIDKETKFFLEALKKQLEKDFGISGNKISYGGITKKAVKNLYDEMMVKTKV